MSGSFEDLDVPPTLVSFAVTAGKTDSAVSPEFKRVGSRVAYMYADPLRRGGNQGAVGRDRRADARR